MDATCYESSVRYPTDVKLLQESIDFMHQVLLLVSSRIGHRLRDDNYYKISKAYKIYSRRRRHSKKETDRLKKRQLGVVLHQLSIVHRYKEELRDLLTNRQLSKYLTIEQVALQQSLLLSGVQVKDRIISLYKAYLRPIVRGKETQPVEFGAKGHLLLVDKIVLIEHLSFEPFNESQRLSSSVELVERLLGLVRLLSADNIYATNKNRRYCSSKGILTNFVRKGRASVNEQALKILRRELSKKRASQMEGVFGVEKQHYDLSKIRAVKASTELLWIVFGIETMNGIEIGRRIRQSTANQREAS
jgi:hypothetical protein